MSTDPQQANSKSDHRTGLDSEIQSQLLVVIATYNEAGNISKLIDSIFVQLPNCHILVIDDHSPDGTGQIVDEIGKGNSQVFCLHRSGKLGLGSATLTGFRWALERHYRWVLTMDADFSHHPESLPEIFSWASKGQGTSKEAPLQETPQGVVPNIVIGSRYIAGGKIEGWPVHRRAASRLINLLTRMAVGLKSYDNSGAYRCYSREILTKLDFEEITNQGYGYLQQILFLANRRGASVKEVPIVFRDREVGQSKINAREAMAAVGSLLSLARRRLVG